MPRPSPLAAIRPPARPGEVERLDHQIVDAEGGIGRPWQALDTLGRMLRTGKITQEMRKSGEIFHEHFRLAALDPLQAADPTRIPVLATTGNRTWRNHPGSLAAHRQVMLALDVLGGLQLPSGSCAWHVLGLEWTIEEWSRSRVWLGRRVGVSAATGILLADLGLLQRYYQVA